MARGLTWALGVMTESRDQSSALIVELAKEFISLLKRMAPSWQKGYWRFDSEETRFGSNASFVSSDGVFLIGAVKESNFYDVANALGRKLWESETDSSKRFRVCLLVVDSAFNYEFKFERADPMKWRITKMNGASGIPTGL